MKVLNRKKNAENIEFREEIDYVVPRSSDVRVARSSSSNQSTDDVHSVSSQVLVETHSVAKAGDRLYANKVWFYGWKLLVVDFLLAVVCAWGAYQLTPWIGELPGSSGHIGLTLFAVLFAVTASTISSLVGIQSKLSRCSAWELAVKGALISILSALVVKLESSFIFYLEVGRYISLLSVVFLFLALFISRFILSSRIDLPKKRVCFVGSKAFRLKASTQYSDWLVENFDIINIIPKYTGSLSQWLKLNSVDQLVVDTAMGGISDDDLADCANDGIYVSTYTEFIESSLSKVPVKDITSNWIVESRLLSGRNRLYNFAIKRGLDIVLSVAGLLFTSPILLIAGILTKLDSPGGVFYSQERVGKGNKRFKIYKLRTMFIDSEKNGAQWASIGDSRVTNFGRLLRVSRIDELPQLWNVLKGEMSLIGPRPERPEFVDDFNESIPLYSYRHLVKPGISGWAQINLPYGASAEDAREKLAYDLFYLKKQNFSLDAQILIRTVGSVSKGSR